MFKNIKIIPIIIFLFLGFANSEAQTKDNSKKVLFVLTSHDALGNTGYKTGFWLEEFATPYYLLKDAGIEITIASPKGGQPPIDPKSLSADFATESTKRYDSDKNLHEILKNTLKLKDIDAKKYDAIFYPGGHGPLWDLANDATSISLIESFYANKKPVATVCHGPAILKNTKTKNGQYIVDGKKVTGFSNTEEAAVQLTEVVPFLLEDMLKENGGIYSKGKDWMPYAIEDGLLITGQNPSSSEKVAKLLLLKLTK
ncbi:type 1 glutamine amidotransferase domain-containing protein [Aureivirga sp. CE67]|uniref:type 1 glutamine amidotransferase domain-containing protein n=1 Tax=Aureivirga sp. CE67 TaxID=1788983 RepID=UPI0018CB6137|nr:type 1 glutamine amidotransferase domain-containing protein [Aureivirga sp. CE67]